MRERAQRAGHRSRALIVAVLFLLGGVWAAHLNGYVLQSFAGARAALQPADEARHARSGAR